MASSPREELGGQTLNRKWCVDENTGTYGAPVWTPVNGVISVQPKFEPTKKEDSDTAGRGAKSKVVTAYEWSVEMKLARKTKADDPLTYDDGQEDVRKAAEKTGLGNVLDIRLFERNEDDETGAISGPTTQAYRGFVVASWGEDGGAMDDLDSCTVVLDGRGRRVPITHPDAAAQDAIVAAISPATDVAAGGALVKITGAHFKLAGVDDVVDIKFGATSATDWLTMNDNEIAVTVPAHAAGAVNVAVENSVGESDEVVAFLYTT